MSTNPGPPAPGTWRTDSGVESFQPQPLPPPVFTGDVEVVDQIKFPDGTEQKTAASSISGNIDCGSES